MHGIAPKQNCQPTAGDFVYSSLSAACNSVAVGYRIGKGAYV